MDAPDIDEDAGKAAVAAEIECLDAAVMAALPARPGIPVRCALPVIEYLPPVADRLAAGRAARRLATAPVSAGRSNSMAGEQPRKVTSCRKCSPAR